VYERRIHLTDIIFGRILLTKRSR